MPNVIDIGVKNVVAPSLLGVVQLPDITQLAGGGGGTGLGPGQGIMTVGSLGFNHGFDTAPAYGSVTNLTPTPPNPSPVTSLIEMRQSETTDVITITFSGNGVPQAAWSDVEIVCPGGTIMLNSITDISVYNPNFGPNTLWTFGGATQPFLGQTADLVEVPYTFS